VTQRGNHREHVFFGNGDPEAYLWLLHAHARRQQLAIFAYCLMPNHVHLVVVPSSADGMHRVMRAVHSQYAQRVNRMREIHGHLWQGRYYSSPLDTRHFLNAIRYVELNPVRAGLASRAEDYAWSSAAARCGRRVDHLLEPRERSSVLEGITGWSGWLAQGVAADCRELLRRNVRRNLPCGSADFIAELEKSAGCELRYRARGGQRKT
jgi:REP-associated tyrosine transposase